MESTTFSWFALLLAMMTGYNGRMDVVGAVPVREYFKARDIDPTIELVELVGGTHVRQEANRATARASPASRRGGVGEEVAQIRRDSSAYSANLRGEEGERCNRFCRRLAKPPCSL